MSDYSYSGYGVENRLELRSAIWVLQEFLKHAIPDYLVSGSDLFSLRMSKKRMVTALDGVAQWIECQPVNPKVTSSIPSQGTCLG